MNKLKKLKPSLTIGIPAYNEGRNISHLVRSILKQKMTGFKLVKILVVCDGCTDNTVPVLKELIKKNHLITIIERPLRFGKADALNLIYKESQSEYLMTMDADVVFIGQKNLNLMMNVMINDQKLNLVGPRHIPTSSKTWFGNFARVSYQSFEDAFLKINNGNNFYAVMAVELLKRKFYKSFTLPKGTVSDQCYVYAKSIEKGLQGFKLVPEAKVVFGVAQTFHDWRILSVRSISGDKNDVVRHFGKGILKYYTMPKGLYIQSLIKWFLKSPIYSIGALIMNLYIRKFPYRKHIVKNGMWELVNSSKEISNLQSV